MGDPEEILYPWLPYLPEKAAFRRRLILGAYYRSMAQAALEEMRKMRETEEGGAIHVEEIDEQERGAIGELSVLVNDNIQKKWAAQIEIEHMGEKFTEWVWADTKESGLGLTWKIKNVIDEALIRARAERTDVGEDYILKKMRRPSEMIAAGKGVWRTDPISYKAPDGDVLLRVTVYKRDQIPRPELEGTPFSKEKAEEVIYRSIVEGGHHSKGLSTHVKNLAKLKLSELSQPKQTVLPPLPSKKKRQRKKKRAQKKQDTGI